MANKRGKAMEDPSKFHQETIDTGEKPTPGGTRVPNFVPSLRTLRVSTTHTIQSWKCGCAQVIETVAAIPFGPRLVRCGTDGCKNKPKRKKRR